AAMAARYGRMGGYAHLATLVRRIRDQRPGKTLLLDGGDTLQGSATSLWTRGLDMVRAMNQLGVEVVTPHWEFTHGIDRVRELFGARNVDVVGLLSHNGLSTDVKMARRVRGIDVILGGHTHDGLPRPLAVGRTLVVNSGAHGKFLSRLDLDVRGGQVTAHAYKLIPVLSNYVAEDEAMAALIREIRAPWQSRLG